MCYTFMVYVIFCGMYKHFKVSNIFHVMYCTFGGMYLFLWYKLFIYGIYYIVWFLFKHFMAYNIFFVI